MGAALAGDRDLGSSCRVLGPPIPEKEAVTGTHALVSAGSVCEGAVVALLGYRTPKGHQPAIAVGCSQCMQNRSGGGGMQQGDSKGLAEELR